MQQTLIQGKTLAIFCDFDGTITDRDVIVMIMEAFAPPVWKDIVRQILDERTLSIREGVTQLFHLIPGSQREEIIRFVLDQVQIRPGFEHLLDFCQANNIPFCVVSGGVDFFIKPVLAPYDSKLTLYCNQGRFLPDRIELDFPYLNKDCEPCGQCACCKLQILDQYDPKTYFRIAIGDSLTDLALAKESDWVFARGRLVDYAKEEDIPITSFETFDEVLTLLSNRLTPEEICHG